jgi:hypothetical protein
MLSATKKKIILKKRIPWTPCDNLPPGSIISFDVGIINLAYCILNYTDGKYTISDWDIINLASGNPSLTCKSFCKSGKLCGKKAYFTDENGVGYCLLHGKTMPGLVRNMTVENVSEFELKKTLFMSLDAVPRLLNVEQVLIENQPLKAREKIKGVGHALFDYYVLRGYIDNKCTYKNLQFIDAKNKLTVYDGPAISCHLKTQYARNKWYGIKYCQWAIKTHPELCLFFEKFKKKDDLADCFLQGAWYLKYGQHGLKGELTSSHQKLVYAENNKLSYIKVRPRPPTKKSLASGRWTLSNIKYALNKGQKIEGALKTSIEFYFTTVDSFLSTR